MSTQAVGQDGRAQNRRSDPGPIGTLLQLRADLSLTDEQVLRLSEIESEVDRQNRPHVEQLMRLRRQILDLGPKRRLGPEGKQLYDSYRLEMRPLLKQIEKNTRAAMEEVGAVLSDSQRRQVWSILQKRHEDRDRRGNSSRFPGRRD